MSDFIVHWAAEPVAVAGATALTMGVFDGLHVGHQALIRETVAAAQRRGVRPAGLTFYPSPDVVIRHQAPSYLLLPEERTALMHALGLEMVVVARFDTALAGLRATEFMQRLCYSFHPSEVWVGADFALGRGREGTVSVLRGLGESLGYDLRVLPRQHIGGEVVSSTLIRSLLDEGLVTKVATFLGRAYSVSGPVVPGNGRGRTLGFATANVAVPAEKRLPADGVYGATVSHEGSQWPAVVNVGVRPTFGRNARTVEAHLLDFDGDLYGRYLTVAFLERLRGERRFADPEDLRRQVAEDIARARRILPATRVVDGAGVGV